jgi:hypothetical protein
MQLAIKLHELALRSGFSSHIQYPTTAHSVMQKASVSYGGAETGVMLAYIGTESDQKKYV